MMQTRSLSADGNILTKKRGISYEILIVGLIGLLLGMAEIGNGFFPFSLIYWSLFIKDNKNAVLFIVTGSTTMGLLLIGGYSALTYIVAGLVGYILYYIMSNIFPGINRVDNLYFVCGSYLLLRTGVNFIFGEVPLYYFLYTGESLIIFLMSAVITEGMTGLDIKKLKWSKSEKVSLVFIGSGILIGLSQMPLTEELNGLLINTIILAVVIGVGYYQDAGSSVLLAAVFGLAVFASGIIPAESVIKFIIPAIICGYINFDRKYYLIPGVLFSFLIYSGFIQSMDRLQFVFLEMFLAGILFWFSSILMEKYGAGPLGSLVSDNKKNVTEVMEVNYSFIDDYFQKMNQLFIELSDIFKKTEAGEESEQKKRVDDFVFLVKNKICKACSRKEVCWHREKKRTSHGLKRLALLSIKKKEITSDEIEKTIGNSCRYYKKIYGGIKKINEFFQLNNFWRDCLLNKQEIVSQQLAGMAKVIKNIKRVRNLQLDPDKIIEKIKKDIDFIALDVFSLKIVSGINPRLVNLNMEIEPCVRGNICQNKLKYLLEKEFPFNFRILQRECGSKLKDRPCKLKYSPAGDFFLEVAVRKNSLAESSGDYFSYKKLDNGEDMLVLADGMGCGEEAARESQTAVNLFEKIITLGVAKDLSVKMINSILYLRSRAENFTTMDICFFDTFNGQLEIRKIGAVSTFIKSGWEVREISAGTPPAGILQQIDISFAQEKLNIEDFVIMISDGVLAKGTGTVEKEEWFKQLLGNSSFENAKELADYLLEEVQKKNKKCEDDLTISVFKVESKKK